MKPSELLSKPGAWCQGNDARNAYGVDVRLLDPSAVCWCIGGAVGKCLKSDDYEDAMKIIRDAAKSKTVMEWNDAPGRTQAEVVALLKSVGL